MNTSNDEVLRQYLELSRHISNAEIMEHIRSAVREALALHGSPLSPRATILFDDTKGHVIVLTDGNLLEGEELAVANAVVLPALCSLLENAQSSHSGADRSPLSRPISVPGQLGTWFFWVLNGAVLLYWCSWFVNFIFSAGFREWYDAAGTSNDLGILGLLLFALLPIIPLITSVSILSARRGSPLEYSPANALMAFEIPALITAFAANFFFSVMPLTDGLRYLCAVCYFAILAYWYLSVFHVQLLSRLSLLLRFILGGITTCWLGYITLLFLPPMYIYLGEEIIPDLLRFNPLTFIFESPLMAMLFIFFVICYFVPIVLVWLIVRHLIHAYRTIDLGMGRAAKISKIVIVLAVPMLFFGLLVAASWQYSDRKVADQLILLSQDEGGYESQAARARDLVKNKKTIDTSLRNYLYAREQYLFTATELSRTGTIGAYIRIVAFPFVYDDNNGISQQGGGRYDPTRSGMYAVLAKGYLRAFGEELSSIQEQKTELPGQVHLISRDVHVVTAGSPIFATVTVTDSLSTNLPSDQEIVYEFSLPEEAVVTGLRLGSALEFKGEIAPRGAAQQTYVNQVRRSSDPALLEQTGPRQYRLRVYPVPGVSDNAERARREKVEGPIQRVQITYIALREADGIPLPTYSERFNVVDESFASTADIDGKKATLNSNGTLLVDRVAKDTLCAQKGEIMATLPGGGDARLIFGGGYETGSPLMTLCDAPSTVAGMSGVRITFLVDTSYPNKDAIGILLKELRALPSAFYSNNTVQLVPFSDGMGEKRAIHSSADVPKLADLIFFGKGSIVAALQATNVDGPDTVVVLTGGDPSFNGTAASVTTEQPGGAKIVFVHPEGEIPAYPAQFDSFLATAYSVNVVTDVETALVRAHAPRVDGVTYPHIGAYWYIKETESSGSLGDTTAIMQLGTETSLVGDQGLLILIAEHSRIAEAVRRLKSSSFSVTSPLIPYDVWYEHAKNIGIVSPLSSYIALVNDTQRNQLASLSQQENRYTNETTFSVTRPGFVSPLGSARGFSRMGQAELGLSGTITTSAPPVFSVPAGGAPSVNSTGGSYANPISPETKPVTPRESSSDILLPRIIILVATFLLLGGGVLATYRILRRTHHVNEKGNDG